MANMGKEESRNMQNARLSSGGRRSALSIMGAMVGLVKPLLPIMLSAIVLGTIGYLCAIFLTILAVQVLSGGKNYLMLLPLLAVARGVLHYAEQYCNHFIAFKLLAIIRHKVFAALRRLCPAKLEGKDKGNLISIITTDIELLEVFYAHTISPIAIAVVTSLLMVFFIGSYHVLAGLLALAGYVVVGAVIPVWNGKRGGAKGMAYRTQFGEMNSFMLDSLRGLEETLQYGQGEMRKEQIKKRSEELGARQKELSGFEGSQRSVTNFAILLWSFAMLFLSLHLAEDGQMNFAGALTCTAAMMGSFGPVVALASLSNNLNQTLASGERVLSLLEEEPVVEEVPERESDFGKIAVSVQRRSRGDFRNAATSKQNENGKDLWKAADGKQNEREKDVWNAAVEEQNKNEENSQNGIAKEQICGTMQKGMEQKNITARPSDKTKENNIDKSCFVAGAYDDVEHIEDKRDTDGTGFAGAQAINVTFAYEEEVILKDYSAAFVPGKITGIHGPSGCGKSTLLKLLMRFWDAEKGNITVDGEVVKQIPTRRLRDLESYVTQDTYVFHDTIAANIAIGKLGASQAEIEAAAKKASLHDWILTLPQGYETKVGELGDTLSGGEKQRIGVARAFLHDAPLLLMDEPTSNLDSLNEGVILKALKEEGSKKTVVLVSHRDSTMRAADVVYEMGSKRKS